MLHGMAFLDDLVDRRESGCSGSALDGGRDIETPTGNDCLRAGVLVLTDRFR